MHALGLPSPFTRRRSQKRLSFAPQDCFCCHVSRERSLCLLIAILAIFALSPRIIYAATTSTRSQKIAVMSNTAPQPQLSHTSNILPLRPLIPLGSLPILPAVLLWFPETENMSSVQVVGVQPESSEADSSSDRWLKIGMLILFGMGLLGMLFS
jgi:hypothetical protein